jgi:hypothetical protein
LSEFDNTLGPGFLEKAAPRQLLSYLRATNLEVGLLLHFGPPAGFFRIVASNLNKFDIRPIRSIRRIRVA